MSIDHAKELNRIANIQDYDDDEDAFEDAGLLLEIALHFERELKSTAAALEQATADLSETQETAYRRTSQLRDAEDRIEQLEAGLLKLANEVAGWRVEDFEIIGGLTNAKVLEQRVQEARLLLVGGSND